MRERRLPFLAMLCLGVASVGCDRGDAPVATPAAAQPDTGDRRDADVGATSDAAPIAAVTVKELDVSALGAVDQTALLRGALRVAVADVTGDGGAELIVVTAAALRVHSPDGTLRGELPIERDIHALAVATLDGRPTIVTGWGRGLQHPEASARVALFRLEADRLVEEVVLEPETERPEVVSVIAQNNELVVSWYQSKFMVETARATRQAQTWSLASTAVIRMATSAAIGDVDADGAPDLVIGRVYGDATGVDGDAFVLRGDQRIPVPTLRGVRGLALVDLDSNGVPEIYLGDGWHQNYGAIAKAQLSRATWTGSGFTTQLIDTLVDDGEYVVWDIVAASTDGAAPDALVARTNLGAYLYLFRDGLWYRGTLGARVEAIAVGDLDGEPGDEVVLAGDGAQVVSLRPLAAP